MAAVRTKIPVGSAPWLVQERRHADELVDAETEEFGYVVRNEMDWLNEHMGEIFSSNNLNVTDIFKTPGKLRGKTPRTARKRNVLGERAPLTDIFAPNPQANASPTKTHFYKQVAQIQIQQDENNDENRPINAPQPPKHGATRSNQNWDSGYHGMTEDEMEIERTQASVVKIPSPKKVVTNLALNKPMPELPAEERRVTDETFVSAKEDLASRAGSREDLREEEQHDAPEEAASQAVELARAAEETLMQLEAPESSELVEQPGEEEAERMDVDDIRSPSDGPSPVKQLLRKSSLNFSSLPAREPLAGKKSIGARSSVLNQGRSSQFGRFTGGKSMGGQQNQAADDEDHIEMDVDSMAAPTLNREESETTKLHHQTTTQRLHDRINMLGQARDIRTSKSIPNFNSSTTQSVYPQIPQAHLDRSEGEAARPATAPAKQPLETALEDDDDDWIAPIASAVAQKEDSRPGLSRTRTAESLEHDRAAMTASDALSSNQSPKRRFSPSRPKMPFSHKKTVSSSAIASPTRQAMAAELGHQKAISVSNPSMPSGHETNTPAGSPRRHLDGAVSATKAKLYSALRSAKGIFASSAGVSAQAKMEALSPAPKPRQQLLGEDVFGRFDGGAMGSVVYPTLESQSRITSAETATSAATATTDGRRTRSSSEREKRDQQEAKQRQKADNGLDKARERERQKAAAAAAKLQTSPSKEYLHEQRPGAPSRTESERSKATAEVDSGDDMPPPPPPKSMLPGPQAQRLREPRRIAKPMKEAPTRLKPAPVTVRMPSQRIGHHQGPSTATLGQSLQETLPPPPPPKPTLLTKSSTASLHSSTSAGTLRGNNPTQQAKKALDAAAKKREQDVKAAQRKADQKREVEQRRAAKQEEERRRQEDERREQAEEKRRAEDERRAEQQRRAAETQRREEAKRNAQRMAVEAKHTEQQRAEQQREHQREQQRLEQQRLEQQRKEQQRIQQNDFAYGLQQERAQANTAHPRSDLGAARPMSRMMQHHDGSRPAVQMNPAKPPKRALQGDEEEQPQRPGVQRNPPSYQQLDAKRRKTNDDEDELAEPRRSVMAPPVRQSNIRKDNKFVHGYAPAPAPVQHTSSMFIKTVTQNHQLNHPTRPNDMAKFANGRIPFADAPNPPGASASANPHKTPARQMASASAKSAAKSSPHYPNPENIHLPEIATDSEDEDSDNEFQAPDWTNSPALRELLTQQQLVDPQSVFGPVAPLRMEEVFRNKERQKKFRDRTSSANWSGADRLTEEERAKDRTARERLMKDGGWTFQPDMNNGGMGN